MLHNPELIGQTTQEQRKRFFGSIMWQDIIALIDNYYKRELDYMANPEKWQQDETPVDRFRGRIETLELLCDSIKTDMLVNEYNEMDME